MKIALYIEDGVEQIILTPQSDTEKHILAKLSDKNRTLSIMRGSFFQCVGGWMRHDRQGDESTMLVLRPMEIRVEPPAPPDMDDIVQEAVGRLKGVEG